MRIELQVTRVDLRDDGTSVVWLRWLVNEPATTYFPSIPAMCDHQDVRVGDWYGLTLTNVTREGGA